MWDTGIYYLVILFIFSESIHIPMHPAKGILGDSDFGTGLGWMPGRSLGCSHTRGGKKKKKVLCPRVSDTVLSANLLPPEDNLVVSNLHQHEETGMWLFRWSADLS